MVRVINIWELEKFVKPFYKRKDPMHNFSHILRIKRKVTLLRKQYKNLNNDLLNFLIYFHGSRRWAKQNKKRIIALGYPASWIEYINRPKTTESKIIMDANMLENVGHFGIKKTLALERYYHQTRLETLNLLEGFIKKYKFYTPLGKKLGNEGIKIKKEWLRKELSRLE